MTVYGGILALVAVVGLLALAGTFGRMFPVPLVITAVVFFFIVGGFFVINPNEATVLQLAGKYVGSVRREGFHWVIPIYSKRKITLRIRNFETGALHTPELKDAHGKVVQSRGHTSGLTSTSGRSPRRTRSISPATCTPI